MRLMTSLALMAASTTAMADCPTRDDLKTGIRFSIQGGETETFRDTGRNRISSYYDYGDGTATGNILLHGHYLTQVTDYVDGKAVDGGPFLRYKFSSEPPVPAANMTWSGVSNGNEEGRRFKAFETHVMGQPKSITFSGCTYTSIPIRSTIDEDGYKEIEDVNYIVELGVGLLIRSRSDDGSDERYTYKTITALK